MVLIAQISDLHIVPPGTTFLNVVDTNELAARAVAALNGLTTPPDAVVVTGDLIDSQREEDYHAALAILSGLSMPWFALAGNHDDPAALKRVFRDQPWAQGEPADQLYYAADLGPLRLIALDSRVAGKPQGRLPPEQLAFLEAELAAAAARPVIVAVHHPPFRTGIAGMDTIMLENADALAAVLARHDNVVRLICGHCHRTIMTAFAGTMATIAPSVCHQIVLALDGDDRFGFTLEPPAYLLHRWREGDGMATHVAHVEPFAGPFLFQFDDGTDKPQAG